MKKLFQIVSADSKEDVQPVLCFRVGEKHCSFAIADKASQTLKSLFYYNSEKINAARLQALAATHPELNSKFHHVFICYDYPQNTLISTKVDPVDDPGNVLRTISQANESALLFSEVVEKLGLQNEFSVPVQIHEWVKQKFTGARYFHQYSLLLNRQENGELESCLVVDFRTDEFVILATKNGQFQLAQTFYYTTPEDVLYYLLKICEQFSLSQQDVQLKLSGLVDKQSALYNSLYQYFIHVEFRPAKWKMQHEQYPAHYFTSLNDLCLCES